MLVSVLKGIFKSRKGVSDSDILRTAGELLGASQHEQAIAILEPMVTRNPASPEALILSGKALRAAGRPDESVERLTRAAMLAPKDAQALFELAMSLTELGDTERALEYCVRARLAAPESAAPRWLQAQLTLGGDYYFAVLERIQAELRPRTYLEIGVFQGESLRFAVPPTIAIGVDPQPQLLAPVAANQRVFAETSDGFFASHDVRAEFGGLPIDLAFIDGMHHFEYALRDFANVERHCTRESTILIHDCYPLDRESARRDGTPPFWSGDVWRLILLLKKYRPDLALHTIGTPPTGLALVRNLDPDSRLLSENHDRLTNEFMALDYAHLDDDKPGQLNLVPNDWEGIRALLRAS